MINKRTGFWLSAAISVPLILRFILPDNGWAEMLELILMLGCVGMLFVPTMSMAIDEKGAVLVARVIVGDEMIVVRSEDVYKALAMLHGTPASGVSVEARIEYVKMSATEFAAYPEYQ